MCEKSHYACANSFVINLLPDGENTKLIICWFLVRIQAGPPKPIY